MERTYKITIDGKKTREYKLHRDILTRANDPKFHKLKPSYIGTTVCNIWLDFQTFASDINSIIGYNEVYCKARNERARELAKRYKEQIDIGVYKALIEYDEVWFDVLRSHSVNV
ncbi:hypothetical protein [Clostridium gasigenes]|uniref:hypothetical protein n=1 Tax=Clostridium gasigenes TaxID=94869 RepID=UPI001C0B6DE0|nr:hypothetical protein [Clostridium gasigenes]MBU3102574.1 hypothetical protein [Clostridium gasigenes]